MSDHGNNQGITVNPHRRRLWRHRRTSMKDFVIIIGAAFVLVLILYSQCNHGAAVQKEQTLSPEYLDHYKRMTDTN